MLPMPEPGYTASERESLLNSLNEQRALVLWKLENLSEEMAIRPVVESGSSLLGIASHLAWVERWWFSDFIGGQTIEYPWSEEDPDADWHPGEGHSVGSISQLYAQAVGESNEIIDQTDLDAERTSGGHKARSLRWVIVHMIEETARHLGHMDIIREQVDGTTGYIPGN